MEITQPLGRTCSILTSLRSFVEKEDVRASVDEAERDVAFHFEHEFQKLNSSQPDTKAIPTFFKPRPKPNSMVSLVKQHARARKEQLKEELLDVAVLRQIEYLIEEYCMPLEEDREVRINYDGFTQVATRCREVFGPAVSCNFKASVFQMFKQDSDGCIKARLYLTYLHQRAAMIHMRFQLGCFDPDNKGILSESQLEDFLEHFSASVPSLSEMPEGFMPLYRRIAARKMLFLHGHNGNVRIKDLVSDQALMAEISDLRIPDQSEEQLIGSWFSLQSTMRVHNTFSRLDEEGNGFLSLQEFSQISGSTMSDLFLNRIFEEHTGMRKGTARDKMDLVAFTDFVLAWDHRSIPAAIKYFFPIFDLKKTGHISPAELYIFFKEVLFIWVHVLNDDATLTTYDVVDELIDMIQPKSPPCITQEDLRVSGMSGIFFSILADAKQFRDYNYREHNLPKDTDE